MFGLVAVLMSLPDTLLVSRAADSLAAPVAVPVAVEAPALRLPPLGSLAALPTTITRERMAPADTGTRKKPRAIAYSEWYGRRVAIHKALSWAMIPLFAVSYYTGDQLAEKGEEGVSETVRSLHPLAAGGAAAVFGVNTVTGVWNLWDSRHDPADRKRRYLHSALFLIADAGFAYAGSLGDEAGDNGATRRRHRNIALASMGTSTAGWLIMLLKKD